MSRGPDDFGEVLRSHRFDDDYYRERSADLARITVPDAVRPRTGEARGCTPAATFEAYTQTASGQKWLEVHGQRALDRVLHRLRDAAAEALLRPLPEGRGRPDGRDQPPVQLSACAGSDGTFAQRAEKELADWRGPSGPSSTSTPPARRCATTPPRSRDEVDYDALGDGLTFMDRAVRARKPRSPGPPAARLFISSDTTDADLFLVLRLFDPNGRGGHLHRGDRPAERRSRWAGCGPRTASSTRSAQRAVAAVPHHTRIRSRSRPARSTRSTSRSGPPR